jgi:hypothetical protein
VVWSPPNLINRLVKCQQVTHIGGGGGIAMSQEPYVTIPWWPNRYSD